MLRWHEWVRVVTCQPQEVFGSCLTPPSSPLSHPGAQDTLSPVSAVEDFFGTFVAALQAVGLPGKLQRCIHACRACACMCNVCPHPLPTVSAAACVTLVASDESGTQVASEKYIYTE